MIRVLIVDDHAVVRQGLEQLLRTAEDIEVTGTAVDGQGAIDHVAADPPDVVLMDLSMPVVDGVEATGRIVSDHPTVQVIVLTSFSDQRRIVDALDAGATGYVLKDTGPDELLAAIRTVHGGGAPLDPRVARALLEAQRSRRPARQLTSREREVLSQLATGMANKQIARRLGITERTVKAHLTSIFHQLGVSDRTQAALWAKDNLPSD